MLSSQLALSTTTGLQRVLGSRVVSHHQAAASLLARPAVVLVRSSSSDSGSSSSVAPPDIKQLAKMAQIGVTDEEVREVAMNSGGFCQLQAHCTTHTCRQYYEKLIVASVLCYAGPGQGLGAKDLQHCGLVWAAAGGGCVWGACSSACQGGGQRAQGRCGCRVPQQVCCTAVANRLCMRKAESVGRGVDSLVTAVQTLL